MNNLCLLRFNYSLLGDFLFPVTHKKFPVIFYEILLRISHSDVGPLPVVPRTRPVAPTPKIMNPPLGTLTSWNITNSIGIT